MNATESGPPRRGQRHVLLAVALLFAAPLLVAILLHASGWEPGATRNAGVLLDPPVALAGAEPSALDGTPLDWSVGERGWNLLVFAPTPCGADCARTYDLLHRVWLAQGRHAARVRVLWFGPLPQDAVAYSALVRAQAPAQLRERVARSVATAVGDGVAGEGMAVHLVDGRGFLAIYHAPGFDPTGLRKDIGRLLR